MQRPDISISGITNRFAKTLTSILISAPSQHLSNEHGTRERKLTCRDVRVLWATNVPSESSLWESLGKLRSLLRIFEISVELFTRYK